MPMNEPGWRLLSSGIEKSPWHRLEGWIGKLPGLTQDWGPIKELRASAVNALQVYKVSHERLEREWAIKLKPLCGGNYCPDFQRFRPLRHSREEDWSDWLAWLLETLNTGLLAETLFGNSMNRDASPFRSPEKKVEREVWSEDRERRADIVAEWNKHLFTHIEVKVWDQNFEKTFETSRLLRSRHTEAKWTDAVLIPETSRAAWENVAKEHQDENVTELLWWDVAYALRQCLWLGREPLAWRAWAWSFCCAIEAHILLLPRPSVSSSTLEHLATVARWVRLLSRDSTETQMTMKPEMKTFLEDGLRLYSDAMDVVESFKAEMEKLLKSAIDKRTQWEPMKDCRRKKPAWGGEGERWVYIMIEGKPARGREIQIECGLWWKAPPTTDPIVYTGVFFDDKRVKLDWKGGTDGIHSFEFYEGTYLYLPIPSSIEIDGPANRLLDAVLGEMPLVLKRTPVPGGLSGGEVREAT